MKRGIDIDQILREMPPDTGFLPGDFWTARGQDPEFEEMPEHHSLCMRLYFGLARWWFEPGDWGRVFEVGVRLGYSLGAFLAGAMSSEVGIVSAVGIDNESYVENSLEIAARNIHPSLRGAKLEFYNADSQEWFIFVDADIYHIDGDHSYDGALHDIETAELMARSSDKSASLIVVDDVHPDNHPGVYEAFRSVAGRRFDPVRSEIIDSETLGSNHKGTGLILVEGER